MEKRMVRALAVLIAAQVALPSPASAADGRGVAGGSTTRITLAFKLDPRLAGSTYGGERWVSPPTYSGASAQRVVEARASAVDAFGAPVKASVEWKVSDPEMVTVSPSRGDQVKITVKRAGESTVTVKSGAASRKLTITAAAPKGIWKVSIIQ